MQVLEVQGGPKKYRPNYQQTVLQRGCITVKNFKDALQYISIKHSMFDAACDINYSKWRSDQPNHCWIAKAATDTLNIRFK